MKVRTVLKFALSLAIALALLSLCFYKIGFKEFLIALKQVKPFYFFLASLMSVAIVLLNTFQLKIFLPRFSLVSFKKMYHLVAIFSMTVNVLPFWGGHALFIYLLGHREKVGKTLAFTVMTLDQIIEGFAKLFVFAMVLLAFNFPGSFPPNLLKAMRAFMIVVLIAYTALFLLSFLLRHQASRLPEVGENLVQSQLKKILEKLKYFVYHWAHHLRVLRSFRLSFLSITLAVLMKFLEVLAVYCIQKSMGLSLGFSAAFLMVAAHSLATSLPLTPGRLGLFEAAAVLTYVYLGLSQAQALALGILIHAVHTLPFVILGYVSTQIFGFKRKELKREAAFLGI